MKGTLEEFGMNVLTSLNMAIRHWKFRMNMTEKLTSLLTDMVMPEIGGSTGRALPRGEAGYILYL